VFFSLGGGFTSTTDTTAHLSLVGTLTNPNYVNEQNIFYTWTCVELSENVECQKCFNQATTTTPTFETDIAGLPVPAITCQFLITAAAKIDFWTTIETYVANITATSAVGLYTPILQWSDITSGACVLLQENAPLDLSLKYTGTVPPTVTLSYKWTQVSGPTVICDRNEYSCGDENYPFLYVPKVEGCTRYEWQVSVTAQYGDVRSETVLNSCPFVAQKSPFGGVCAVVKDSTLPDGCDMLPLTSTTIECSGWKVGCDGGVEEQFIYYAYDTATVGGSLVLVAQSNSPTITFGVGTNKTFYIVICTATGACSDPVPVSVHVCSFSVLDPEIAEALERQLYQQSYSVVWNELTMGLFCVCCRFRNLFVFESF